MTMSDPIADMLTRMRNAILRKYKEVMVPSSKIKKNILDVLLQEGFITNYKKERQKIGENLIITLKYDEEGTSIIRRIERISKPGLCINKGYKDLKPILGGQGIQIISTSKGVISDSKCRENKIGGEILCQVY